MSTIDGLGKTACLEAVYSAYELSADIEQDKVQSEINNGDSWALADSQNVATEYNGLAAVAQRNNCVGIARNLYLKVIETYVGAGYEATRLRGYEATRQRAQIGIDDLRAKKPDGSTQPHASPP